jgi:hypothetical protein
LKRESGKAALNFESIDEKDEPPSFTMKDG